MILESDYWLGILLNLKSNLELICINSSLYKMTTNTW